MKSDNTLLYQVEQIRKFEKIALLKYGISEDVLMERAGQAAFCELRKKWPKVKNITVICGKGNNAGDGYIVAHQAKAAKLNVKILQLVPDGELKGAVAKAALKCKKLKIKALPFSVKELKGSDIIVDAILGTGVVGKVYPKFKTAINAINLSKIPVLAIDLPSGINANTGAILGAAILAKLTVTFIGQKIGLFTGPARDYCGEIICNDLLLPKKIFQSGEAIGQLLNLKDEIKALPPRKPSANKGSFGHVLIIGGDYGMYGAVRMAGEAALRVGAGLVTVATRPKNSLLINAARPEIMAHGVNSRKQLHALLKKANVVVVGPGLGTSSWGKSLFNAVLQAKKSLVVDADALNILAFNNKFCNTWILTPHPGEAARLLRITSEDVQNNRVLAVTKIQQIFGGIAVLKGAGTLIAKEGEAIRVCNAGNPGMASGGMGDILSGMIGGLVAQGLSLFDAAKLGVLVHALAGDLVAKKQGKLGMLALDLLAQVRKILND